MSFGEFLICGVKGCFESYLKVLCEVEMKGIGSVLIFEDDVDFLSDIEEIFFFFMRDFFKCEWDIFLGYLLDGFCFEEFGFWLLFVYVLFVKFYCYGVIKYIVYLVVFYLENIYK